MCDRIFRVVLDWNIAVARRPHPAIIIDPKQIIYQVGGDEWLADGTDATPRFRRILLARTCSLTDHCNLRGWTSARRSDSARNCYSAREVSNEVLSCKPPPVDLEERRAKCREE